MGEFGHRQSTPARHAFTSPLGKAVNDFHKAYLKVLPPVPHIRLYFRSGLDCGGEGRGEGPRSVLSIFPETSFTTLPAEERVPHFVRWGMWERVLRLRSTRILIDLSSHPGWHRLARFGAYRCALAQEVFAREHVPARTSSGSAAPVAQSGNRGHPAIDSSPFSHCQSCADDRFSQSSLLCGVTVREWGPRQYDGADVFDVTSCELSEVHALRPASTADRDDVTPRDSSDRQAADPVSDRPCSPLPGSTAGGGDGRG